MPGDKISFNFKAMNQAELRAGAAVGRAVGSLGAAGGDTRGERGRAVRLCNCSAAASYPLQDAAVQGNQDKLSRTEWEQWRHCELRKFRRKDSESVGGFTDNFHMFYIIALATCQSVATSRIKWTHL